jgi:hypothetical protein
MLKVAYIALALALPASLISAALWNDAAEAQEPTEKGKKKAPAKAAKAPKAPKAPGAKQTETPLSCKLYGRGC